LHLGDNVREYANWNKPFLGGGDNIDRMPEHGRDLSARRFAQAGAKTGTGPTSARPGECSSLRSPSARTVTAATTHSAQLQTVNARDRHGTRNLRVFERTAVVRRTHTGCVSADRMGT
jgi:hypothetical protein